MEWQRWILIATLAWLAPDIAAAQSTALQQQFVDAYRIAQAGTPAVTPDSNELRDYALYPYLEAARLGRDLTANGAISDFQERHRGEPVARTLRNDWLSALGTKREWRTYLNEYIEGEDSGATLRCYALAARIALGRDEHLQQDAVAAWLVPDSAPDACAPVFAWLRSRGQLTPALI